MEVEIGEISDMKLSYLNLISLHLMEMGLENGVRVGGTLSCTKFLKVSKRIGITKLYLKGRAFIWLQGYM